MNLVLGVIPKKISNRIFLFVAAVILTGGFFAVSYVLAVGDAVITPASGGEGISIDTTSHASCLGANCGTFIELSGPSIAESAPGNIAAGTHTISLPLGWKFKPGATVKVIRTAGNISPAIQDAALTADTLSFTIDQISTDISSLAFILNSMQVGPTGTSPSAGNMTHSGAAISGVENGVTNFGILSTIAGTVTQLTFTTPPSDTVYGSTIGPVTVVRTQDQFGNNSTSGLIATEMVSLSLTGTGVLQGTLSLDIGTGGGTPGTVTFTDLKVSGVGAIGTKQLTASAGTLTNAVSDEFVISQKTLTATVTVDDKPYDGNNSAVIIGVITLNDVEAGDDVTVSNDGTATFASPNADTNIVVTSNGVTIAGAHTGNYLFGGTATGNANITPLEITVTSTAGQNKIYGQSDPVFTYTNIPALIGIDGFTGSLSRVAGEDVGVYAITQGNLSAGNNYNITFVADNFSITKRPITVEATASSKVYDGNTTSAGIPTITAGTLATGDSANFTQIYSTTNVATGKKLTPSGTAGGNSGNNYEYTFTYKMNGTITEKELTVSGLSVSNKVYDGNINTTINGAPSLVGIVGTDDVSFAGTATGSFNNANVGSRTVAITGLSLTGTAMGNYTLTQPVLNAEITPLGITGSFTADNKIYNGTTVATVLMQSLTDVLPGDIGNVVLTGGTASFATRNVGDEIIVTASGMVLGGSASLNYNLTSVDTTTADITKKSINVTAQTDTKTYDGTTLSDVAPIVDALEDEDTVETVPTQEFDTKDVANGKTLSVNEDEIVINDGNSGLNYDVNYVNDTTGEIEKKNLTVSGATTNSKTYDGGVIATVNFGGATLVDIIGTEDVTLNSASYSAIFDNKNVATGKTVTVSGLALAGAGASNYSLTQPILNDGVITQKTLTVTATGVNKVYDADSTATVTLGDNRVGGDVLTLGYTANFSDKNVANSKAVSVTGIAITGGVDQGNYILGNTTAATTADITQAPLTATVTVEDKVVDGNNSAMITGRTLIGVLGTDAVTPNADGVATFAEATVGAHAVSATGITLAGADALNYAYDGTATGIGNILPIPTEIFVDDDFPEGVADGHTFGYDAFNTIQEGIDAVADWGTVNVAAGTYAEPIVTCDGNDAMFCIDKSLTITGDPGAQGETIDDVGPVSTPEIDGGGQFASAFVISSGVSNVVIEGFEIHNFANDGISGGIGSGILSWNSGATNITIQDNHLYGLGWNGVLAGSDDGTLQSGWTVKRNIIDGADYAGIELTNVTGSEVAFNDITIGGGIVWDASDSGVGIEVAVRDHGTTVTAGTGVSIYDNEVDGDKVQPERAGINILSRAYQTASNALLTGVTVQNNTVTGAERGIYIVAEARNGGTASVGALSIDGNTLDGNGDGLVIYDFVNTTGTATHSGVSIVNNDIINSTGGASGIHILANTSALGMTVSENIISDNIGFGIHNEGTETLNAVHNWWGSETGPTHTNNPTGTGNSVSDGVLYRPWYTAADMAELDETAPTAEIISSEISPTNANPIPVSVTFSENVSGFTVGDIAVANGTAGNFIAVNGLEYTFDITPAGEGEITVNIAAEVAWDLAGNYNEAADQFSITYDSVAPNAPVIDNIAEDDKINNAEKSAIVVAGTAEADSLVSVTLSDGANNVTETQQLTGGATAFSIIIDGDLLNDGTITPSVTATDAAGNTSAADTDPTALKDTSAPVITINDGTSSSWTQTDTIILTVTETNPSTNKYGFSPDDTCDASDTISTNFTSGAGFNITGDRNDYLCAKATDTAGNETYQRIGQLNTDNTVPDLTLNSMFTGQTLTGGNVYPISWTANDLHLSDTPVKLEYSVNGGTSWTTITEATANDGSENWTVPSVNTSNGLIRTTVTDLATNASQADSDTFSITYSIVTDSTAPVATLNSPNGGETWENNAAHLITWTATDNITAAASLDIKLEYSTDGGTIWTTIIADTENDGAYSWTPTGLSSTNVLIKITATDAAGLTGSDISNTALTIATPVAYPESICTGSSQYSCSISLSTGWNLVSFPIIPTNTAIDNVLAGLSGGGTVDIVKYYDSTDPDDWKSYVPGSGGDLTSMQDGKGYWISMTAPATLTVTGTSAPAAPNPPSTYDVISGWNLIGYKSLTAYQNASAYLSAIPSGYIVFDQNNINKTSSYLQHGKGYWLWSTGAGSIVAGD